MPLIRKVIAIGKTSKGVILAKGWLQYYEDLQGLMVQSVAIEVNHELKITPIFSSRGRKARALRRAKNRDGRDRSPDFVKNFGRTGT